MTTLRTYILDDEAHAVDLLTGYVQHTPALELAGSSTDPVAALHALKADPPALLLLDVGMPGLSGLELAGLTAPQTQVIFTTSYREFGPEAYELNAAGYLLKPIAYARFLAAIGRLQPAPAPDFIFVKGGIKGEFLKIALAGILYIQSSLHYADIVLAGETITTYLTLNELMERLPPADFCRVHRSFIVNLNRVTAIEQGQLRLDNGRHLSLGRLYREDFFKKIAPSLVVSAR